MLATKITLEEKIEIVERNLAVHENTDTFFLKFHSTKDGALQYKEVLTKLELLERLPKLTSIVQDDRYNAITVWKIKETTHLHEQDIEGGTTALSNLYNAQNNSAKLLNNFAVEIIVTHAKVGFVDVVLNSSQLQRLVDEEPESYDIKKFPTYGEANKGNLAFKESIKVYKVTSKVF